MQRAHYEDDRLLVRKMAVGNLDNNCYWLACKETSKAVLIDAADEPGTLLEAATDLDPQMVVITHGHWDHIQAVTELRRHSLPVGIHAGDAEHLKGGGDFELTDGQVLSVGKIDFEIRHTPGHTPGSICVIVPPVAFTGDTLFPGGPGNTANPGGNFSQIIESITSKVFSLDDATRVMPGHGRDTTIGTERPHLDEWIERGW